jgi:hypothetical protein
MAFDQANIQASDLAQQVSADQAALGQLQQKVDSSRAALRHEALMGYTGGASAGAAPTAAVAFGSDPSVRAEYLQVAAGNISNVVDQYRTQEQQLATAETNLTRQELASRAAMSAVESARQQALAQAAAEQSQLDQLQVRLNGLIEAAAVASEQRPAPSSTQGLPVNNGLVAVVQNIVSPPPPATGGGGAGGNWLRLRECESGNNYRENTGNGYYGGYQFSEQTWTDLGLPGRPDLESPGMQDSAAMKLQSEYGWGQWPACSAALGLR